MEKMLKAINETDICSSDVFILRKLARQVAVLAESPIEQAKATLWRKHNDLETDYPLLLINPENGWREIIPEHTLSCTGNLAREWELRLRKTIYHGAFLKDDFVIDKIFVVPHVYSDTGWGIGLKRIGGENGGAYHIDPPVVNYEESFEQLHFPQIIVDYARTNRRLNTAHEIFDTILEVRNQTSWWWSLGLTWHYIDLRGLENFLCDFIEEPEWVHRMMEMLCSGTLNMLDNLQKENLLSSNNGNVEVGSGGYGFTNQLKQNPEHVTTIDMWGFVESQETSSVSPEMYGEFIFPYHKRIAEKFGLNCFGCCEPYDPRWIYAKQLPNLRRVSCSPWSVREHTKELLTNQYICSHKISPTPLASPHMDATLVREQIRTALECSAGCIPELIMKDNHTLGNNPQNAIRWVEIAREEISRIYGEI